MMVLSSIVAAQAALRHQNGRNDAGRLSSLSSRLQRYYPRSITSLRSTLSQIQILWQYAVGAITLTEHRCHRVREHILTLVLPRFVLSTEHVKYETDNLLSTDHLVVLALILTNTIPLARMTSEDMYGRYQAYKNSLSAEGLSAQRNG